MVDSVFGTRKSTQSIKTRMSYVNSQYPLHNPYNIPLHNPYIIPTQSEDNIAISMLFSVSQYEPLNES